MGGGKYIHVVTRVVEGEDASAATHRAPVSLPPVESEKSLAGYRSWLACRAGIARIFAVDSGHRRSFRSHYQTNIFGVAGLAPRRGRLIC